MISLSNFPDHESFLSESLCSKLSSTMNSFLSCEPLTWGPLTGTTQLHSRAHSDVLEELGLSVEQALTMSASALKERSPPSMPFTFKVPNQQPGASR